MNRFVLLSALVVVLPRWSLAGEPSGPQVPFPVALELAAVVQDRIDDIGKHAVVLGNGDQKTHAMEASLSRICTT